MVTPEKGFSKEGKLGRKILDGTKYVGKNFWKVLPIGVIINNSEKIYKLENKIAKTKEYSERTKLHSKRRKLKRRNTFSEIYSTSALVGGALYLVSGFGMSVWNLKQWEEYKQKQNAEQKYIQQVDSTYNTIFKDADSLEIYQKYGLPIKLEKPSFEQKERIVKNLDSALVE